jgi:signal transduction histidine kinase
LVKNIIHQQHPLAKKKGHSIDYSYDTDNAIILVDPDHIKVILTNLIDNAVKYSSGPSTIDVQLSVTNDGFILHVKDLGIGIPRSHIKNIFKKFYRVEDSLSAKTKGHGLGLSIVQGLMELNKGTVTVKSEWQKGSTFTLFFPEYNVQPTEINNPTQRDGVAVTSTRETSTLASETIV